LEEIENLLKVWLPHIRVREPKEFRKRLLEEMKWWQKGGISDFGAKEGAQEIVRIEILGMQ